MFRKRQSSFGLVLTRTAMYCALDLGTFMDWRSTQGFCKQNAISCKILIASQLPVAVVPPVVVPLLVVFVPLADETLPVINKTSPI
jgi:hypothetical protein